MTSGTAIITTLVVALLQQNLYFLLSDWQSHSIDTCMHDVTSVLATHMNHHVFLLLR